jgi:hypothetical protein
MQQQLTNTKSHDNIFSIEIQKIVKQNCRVEANECRFCIDASHIDIEMCSLLRVAMQRVFWQRILRFSRAITAIQCQTTGSTFCWSTHHHHTTLATSDSDITFILLVWLRSERCIIHQRSKGNNNNCTLIATNLSIEKRD